MSDKPYLRFLRPYLLGARLGDHVAYSHLACLCRRPLTRGSLSRRALHSSTAWRSARIKEATSHEAPEEESSRPFVIQQRVAKLREFNVFNYPRLNSEAIRVSIPDFRKKYKDEAATPAQEDVVLQGRIISVRRAGPVLVFITMIGGYERVQLMVELKALTSQPTPEEFKAALHPFLRGDVVSAKGRAIRSDTGELSLLAVELPQLISPGLAPLPKKLTNEGTIARKRHLDLLVNPQSSDVLRLRATVFKSIRNFLDDRSFLEVQTPMLAGTASGAIARPFLTSASEFPEKELSLRIAPELWLKRLVVGGNDRVYEIGQSFRNEGLDGTHNPEFTTCEFYSAYSTLADLILHTENLIRQLAEDTSQLFEEQLRHLQKPTINLPAGQWKQVEFIPSLEEILGIEFPDLSHPTALRDLKHLLAKNDWPVPSPGTSLNLLLDDLASTYLEPLSRDQPLFVTHHPACISLLSKSFVCPQTGQLVAARAELFLGGKEIANMYEEENDPFEQRRKFEDQIKLRNTNSKSPDAKDGPTEVDESYIQALEHGLPPTGGWGCGVDRLVMLFGGINRIDDVLSFGNLRHVVSLSQVGRDS